MEENKAVQGAEVKEIKVEFSDEAKCEKQCNDTDGSSSKKKSSKELEKVAVCSGLHSCCH